MAPVTPGCFLHELRPSRSRSRQSPDLHGRDARSCRSHRAGRARTGTSATLFALRALNRALAASSRQSRYASTVADLQLGLPELRRAISQRYLELGYSVPMDEIIVTCGGMEAISLSL